MKIPENAKRITPQPGFQNDFLSSSADIVIGGGAAGAGKTYALLLEAARNSSNPKFGAVIFRRTSPQIRSEGGLWDTASSIYPLIYATAKESTLEWQFQSGATVSFSHLEYEKNLLDWQGSQMAFIGFDELTHFTEKMFFYLMSRNRSTCGVKPYIRATCNPDPDSFLVRGTSGWGSGFISWWIDPETGFPIKERAGKLRYFLKDGDSIYWGDTKKEVAEKAKAIIDLMIKADPNINPFDLIKSVTFIPGDVYENRELLSRDAGYLANLLAQDENTKAQLLHGNWKVRIDGNELIHYIKMRDVFGNSFIKGGKKYITADIALKGSDLLIVGVWDGFRWIDVDIMEKSKGNEVIDAIKKMAAKWTIPQSHILYDDDGVGQFVDGFIRNANAFKNAGKPFNEENYRYLRDQLYFKMADRINNDGYFIAENVLTKFVKGKKVIDWLMDERRAIKQDKPDNDGKLAIIPKQERKAIIGHSTDFMDVWMMREWFEFNKQQGLSAAQIVNYI